ncbi:MAG TPA: hydroxymethylbilane synthase, partial [Roseomonas sp.]|nr:hydroxymethylbilane synthase [Roseomonas sp.]
MPTTAPAGSAAKGSAGSQAGRAGPGSRQSRASPLALWQPRDFLDRVTRFCPVLRNAQAFEEHA